MNKRKKSKLAGITILTLFKYLLVAIAGWLVLVLFLDLANGLLSRIGITNEILQETILLVIIVLILIFVFRMKPKKLARKIV